MRIIGEGGGTGPVRAFAGVWLVVLVAAGFALLLSAPAASALGPTLVRFGEGGSGAGQVEPGVGGGLAADPDSGHVFISDRNNNRIDEFTAWGQFVKSWGWGVRDGSAELQTCTAATSCRAGLVGFGPGQLKAPNGIAIGRSGDIFVFEGHTVEAGSPEGSQRVQVFTPAGEFLRMFGGGVDHTTGADVCTKADVEAGDVCGAGTEGTGPSEFSATSNALMFGDYIDIAPDGTVYVADRNRIQEFEEDGTFTGEITFAAIHASEPAFPETGEPGMLAVDPQSGDIYLGFAEPTISEEEQGKIVATWRIKPPVALVPPAPLLTSDPSAAEPAYVEALATDAQGNLYASIVPIPPEHTRALFGEARELSSSGEPAGSCCTTEENGERLRALATNVVNAAGESDLYILRSTSLGRGSVEVVGPPPDKWPPPAAAPTIEAQFPTSVTEESADLQATIDPNFWQDTHYYLEYGSGPCSAGGCPTKVPAPPGALLESGIVKRGVDTQPVRLQGLAPGTTYHFRFVAESSGGGPVFGEDPDGAGPEEATVVAGREKTFTTLRVPSGPVGGCPNEAFRTGPSAALEDCRAYEMVSPVDKAGGDILTQCNIECFPARLDQGAPDGESITYSSFRSFAEAESAAYTSQYLAARGGAGWSTRPISPPLEPPPLLGNGLDSPFEAFSEDLSSGWLVQDYARILAPGAVRGLPNIYRRDNGLGTYEAITTAPPIGAAPEPFLELQGFSANGKRTVFGARMKLTENASGDPTVFQVYESFKGVVRLVSVRPGGGASPANATAGSISPRDSQSGRDTNLDHAVSEEGNRIYWSEPGGEGKLYVRVNGTQTRQVSAGPATFWAASPSGSRALYTEGGGEGGAEAGPLRLYDLASESSSTLAETVLGVLGESEGLSRVYFVATGALAGEAKQGEPNLFFYEAGHPLTYVATLAAGDLPNREAPSPIVLSPRKHVAHVNPEGTVAVFMSQAALTGAENIGLNGKPHAEVFRFDSRSDQLTCISCSPTGVRSSGPQWTSSAVQNTGYWYASKIPTWEFNLHAARVLSANGNRVFFDTYNRLTASDTNNALDVYSWEAPGTGTCARGNSNFTATWGGCVALVSIGTDPTDSELVDASADGRDVFFLTGASLVSTDPGQIDLYDAREGGGFPEPGSGPVGCEGEACQPKATPPAQSSNASQDFVGPGNLRPKPPCRKGTVRRGGKCVKKHHPRHRGRGRLHHGHKHGEKAHNGGRRGNGGHGKGAATKKGKHR